MLALGSSFTMQPWQHPKPVPRSLLDEPWRQWLLDTGSLTQNVKNLAPDDFSLRLLNREFSSPSLSEANALGIQPRHQVYVREVALCIDATPHIYARSLIPRSTLTASERQLLKLNTQPLGEFLFSHKHMRRGPIEIKQGQLNQQTVWARRSIFYINHKPLLVCEYFLPSLLHAGTQSR